MALCVPHSIFHLARLLYVRPETSGPYYVFAVKESRMFLNLLTNVRLWTLQTADSTYLCVVQMYTGFI